MIENLIFVDAIESRQISSFLPEINKPPMNRKSQITTEVESIFSRVFLSLNSYCYRRFRLNSLSLECLRFTHKHLITTEKSFHFNWILSIYFESFKQD